MTKRRSKKSKKKKPRLKSQIIPMEMVRISAVTPKPLSVLAFQSFYVQDVFRM
jgi:hypothetical protein